jgi:outer membrane protein OmpA-like peptidoglycan-associated protein
LATRRPAAGLTAVLNAKGIAKRAVSGSSAASEYRRYLSIHPARYFWRNHRTEEEMKLAAGFTIATALLWLGGCAAVSTSDKDSKSGSATRMPANIAKPAYRQSATDLALATRKPPMRTIQPASPQTESNRYPEPDAVVKLDPRSGSFSMEMESRLWKIADEMKKDERIILRLESHVPDRGSSALNIGIAENALQRVKDRLQTLGVLSRRILLASFGSEHERDRDPMQHWVEIYLLRPA